MSRTDPGPALGVEHGPPSLAQSAGDRDPTTPHPPRRWVAFRPLKRPLSAAFRRRKFLELRFQRTLVRTAQVGRTSAPRIARGGGIPRHLSRAEGPVAQPK